MASVAAFIVFAEMLKDDGGLKVMQVLEGGYKRKSVTTTKSNEMGVVARRVAIRQVAKQAAKSVRRQSLNQLAKIGANKLAKGAAVSVLGIGADAVINEM